MPVARYLIPFALGLMVALLLAGQRGLAGLPVDTDGDGVVDLFDNCTLLQNANGLPAPGTSCDSQEDGDQDGIGNPCDSDVNNNGAFDLVDVSMQLAAAAAVSTNLHTDLNCNGAADLVDVSTSFFWAATTGVPGPSGLACAGTIPCP